MSNIDALNNMMNVIIEEVDTGENVALIWCGLSKAFDCVGRMGKCGICGLPLSPFQCYLSNSLKSV